MRGARPGERRGGRQKGTRNKKTEELLGSVAGSGLTPMEFQQLWATRLVGLTRKPSKTMQKSNGASFQGSRNAAQRKKLN